jgi:hypothetical protein
LRDQINALGSALGLEDRAAQLDQIIGTLLGTREAPLVSQAAKARVRGVPFDARRIELFQKLHDGLRQFPPEPVRPWQPAGNAAVNQAFFEAYFSNFIEGTEFGVDEARAIIFEGVIPGNRPADAHDVLGTFRIVSDVAEMRCIPSTAGSFIDLLRHRDRTIMAGRPEVSPGEFKDRPNQFGTLIFVTPEDVRGTLIEGFRIYERLSEPLHRAIFMNGRVARVMMNAELAAAQQVRVLVPIIYRSNYLSALRALSGSGWPEPIIKTMAFAQRYAATVPWDDLEAATDILARTNAFVHPEEGDEKGIRLRIPVAADIAKEN